MPIAFWTLFNAIIVQFSILGWSQDKGLIIVKYSIIVMCAMSAALLLGSSIRRGPVIAATLFVVIAHLVLAPALGMK
jgi:hypothetical protein